MNVKTIVVVLAVVSIATICGAGDLYSRNFDWEPFKAGSFALDTPKWENTAGRIDPLEFRSDQSLLSGNGNGKGALGDARELELDFRRFKFSISRYVFNTDRDHTIRRSDLERQRESLVHSLPSIISGTSNQDRFDALGKIFEPNINLKIEF